jgi:hypothetical protein
MMKTIGIGIKEIHVKMPCIALLVCFLLISFIPIAPLAGPSAVFALETNNEENPQIMRFQRKSVTIKSKTRKKITTSAYSQFAVTTGILIYGPDGIEVSLEDLQVPCEAEVVYMRENGKVIAKRINVKHIWPNATTLLLPDGETAE